MTTASLLRTITPVLLRLLAVLVLLVLVGCSSSAPPPTAAAPTTLPPLQGSYRAPTGDVFVVSGPGTYRATGGAGTFMVSGDRVDLVRDDGQPIRGHRPDADRLVLSSPDGATALTFYRAGSAAAQTPEALTRPAAVTPQPAVPTPDPAVPLERYAAVTDPEMLRELAVAFSQDPFGEKSVADLLPESPSTADAFALRERVEREGKAVVERLKAYREHRYYRLSATTVPVEMPRTAADFQRAPRLVWAPTSGVRLKPYDFDRKGFPMACLHTGAVSVYPMPVLDFVASTPRPQECFLPVPDEAVARRIEAKRAAGDGTFPARADLYWHAVGPRGGVLQANLTHVELTLFSSTTLDGANALATFALPL